MRLFTKIPTHCGGGVFISYINSVASKINGSDLIYVQCASDMFSKYEKCSATFYSRLCKFLLHRARKSQVSTSKCLCLTSMSLPPGIAPLVTTTHAHQLYLNISISNQRLHFW
jgi:hypothetical protein